MSFYCHIYPVLTTFELLHKYKLQPIYLDLCSMRLLLKTLPAQYLRPIMEDRWLCFIWLLFIEQRSSIILRSTSQNHLFNIISAAICLAQSQIQFILHIFMRHYSLPLMKVLSVTTRSHRLWLEFWTPIYHSNKRTSIPYFRT